LTPGVDTARPRGNVNSTSTVFFGSWTGSSGFVMPGSKKVSRRRTWAAASSMMASSIPEMSTGSLKVRTNW
jgi:hypothetical protein